MRVVLVGIALASVVGCDSGTAIVANAQACGVPVPLTSAEVTTIIEQAAARAAADGEALTIAVTNREGVVAGVFEMAGAPAGMRDPAVTKALTASFLSSNQHSFTTRTAAFIIMDHFPPGLPNVPGGPLFGVQFSSLPCSDVVGVLAGAVFTTGSGLSGEPGSLPLYKDGCLVGAVATAGGSSGAAMERAAWAGAAGFRPVQAIWGSNIFIDGIRLEFFQEMPPDIPVVVPFAALPGTVLDPVIDAPADTVFPTAVIGGITVEVFFPIVDSPLPGTPITAADVMAMFEAAAARSERTRAGIRRPLGVAARTFISVTDLDGNILGCIRTPEATLFSFDVCIQKARTAAFFSSDTAGFTTRGLGFLAQGFYPPGIDGTDPGPLNGLQAALSADCGPPGVPLPNGITVFPGGVPIYKGGVLVGAIGVSGDGVDQDDFIASAGADLFPAPDGVRADTLGDDDLVPELRARLEEIKAAAGPGPITDAVDVSLARLDAFALKDIRQPWVKFPRQPLR